MTSAPLAVAAGPGAAGEDLAALPKVVLHDHLDGGLRAQTMIELAAAAGHELPAREAPALEAWFLDAASSGSLERYLETFAHALAVLQTAEALERVAAEHVLDAAAEGVVHLEVRWAPEQHVAGGLDLQEAVEAVAAGLERGVAEAAARGHRIGARQILCAMRQNDRSPEIARLAVENRDRGVVAFDLAGPEEGFAPARHREALDHCAEHFLPTTLHAGEAAGLDSIRSALLDGRALRLGHGVRILDDVELLAPPETPDNVTPFPARDAGAGPRVQDARLGELAAWVRDRGIVLETCPCSNLQTGAARTADSVGRAESVPAREHAEHPADLLRRLDFAVTVNPDNRLVSGTSMTREFRLLAESFGWGREEFLETTLTAALGAFLPAEERNGLVERVLAHYEDGPEDIA